MARRIPMVEEIENIGLAESALIRRGIPVTAGFSQWVSQQVRRADILRGAIVGAPAMED